MTSPPNKELLDRKPAAQHVVFGYGQVGQAIVHLLKTQWVYDIDKGKTFFKPPEGRFHLHICFPYSTGFEDSVSRIIEQMKPELTVIHSTVPVGTSEKLGTVASPVRGRHPFLAESLTKFLKYFGGVDAHIAAQPFEERGVPIYVSAYPSEVEAAKLWDTTQLAWFVILEKAIHAYCKERGLNFDEVYTWPNLSNARGYKALGMEMLGARPSLQHKPGPIGGHCVMPNLDMLESWVSQFIWRINENIERYGEDLYMATGDLEYILGDLMERIDESR